MTTILLFIYANRKNDPHSLALIFCTVPVDLLSIGLLIWLA